MASKRRMRRNGCEGKKRYETQKEAEHGRNYLVIKTMDQHKSYVNVYHCKFCGGWHVGHLSKRQNLARTQSRLKYAN